MVDLARTIAIIFEGDDRSAEAFKKVDSNLSNFSSGVESVAGKLAIAADAVIAVDAALAALAVGGLAYAYAKSVDFESAVVELQKVLGRDQVDALNDAKVAAMDLSNQYGVSSSEILLSMANFKQAGFEIGDAMTLVKDSLDLVIAGDIDAAQASEYLIAALKGFDQPATEAARLIDILNEVSNNYATDVEQLAIGMAALSPIAKTMGFSMEETAGLLTPIIEIFRSGDEAATALKTGLLRLVDDSKPVREALAAIGVSQTDANGAMRSGKDILFDVATAFVNLEQNQKLFLAQQLVGINQAGRMVTVFDGLAKTTDVTATALNSAGSAAQEVAARLASSQVQIDRFKTGFENLAITIGDQFRVAVTEAISGATEIERVLKTMVDQGTFDPIFELINEFSGKLGEYLKDVAANLPAAFEDVDFSGLLDAIRNLFGAFNEYMGDLDLRTPEGLATALQNVVDILTGLVRITEGMVDAFRPFVEQIEEFILTIAHGDEDTQRFAGTLLAASKIISEAGLGIFALLAAMQESGIDFGWMFEKIVDAAGAAMAGIVKLYLELKLFITDAAIAVNSILDLLSVGMTDFYSNNVEYLKTVRDAVKQDLIDNEDTILKYLSKLTGGFIDAERETRLYADSMDSLGQSTKNAAGSMEEAAQASDEIAKHIDVIPDEKRIEFTVSGADLAQKLEDFGWDLSQIPDERLIEIAATTDDASFFAAMEKLAEDFPDARPIDVVTVINDPSVSAAQQIIEEKIPEEKQVAVAAETDSGKAEIVKKDLDDVAEDRTAKIGLEVDEMGLDRLKNKFELMQTAVEWKAKLDIADVEANAKIVSAAFGTLSSAFSSSADIISSAIGVLGQLSDKIFDVTGTRQFMEQTIRRELDLRERAMYATESLIDTQIRYMESKIRSMESGDALIEIDGKGLQPHLEAFMWEILSQIQMRVNAEGHAMLFGID